MTTLQQDLLTSDKGAVTTMRRSLCYTEPSLALAGEVDTWKFIYSPAMPLPKGARLKFDLRSEGREIDWEVPSTNLRSSGNVIYGMYDDEKVVQAQEVEVPDHFVPQFEFTLPTPLDAGDKFTILMGAPHKSKAKNILENGCQTQAERRRTFLLYVDPKGKGNFEEPETFSIDVKGNVLTQIRILVPSLVTRNKRFDIVVRFEDEFGNLTANAPEDTLIDLSYEHLRENLNWKLFVPETGFVNLPNLYFNEEGIYRIKLSNLRAKEDFISPPIKCINDASRAIFWGLLHGESDRYDSAEDIENCLRSFRDDSALDFFASSCFENADETPNDVWKLISQSVQDMSEEDRFIIFQGCQWEGEVPGEGLRHLLFAKDSRPIPRVKDVKYNNIKKIYKSYSSKDLISIPSFTMGKGHSYDFNEYNPDFERVIEIYNAWGSSERSAKQGNPWPITCPGKNGIKENPDGSIINALKKNCRFGFIAGGLDDRGVYAELFDSDQVQYSPGLTAILSENCSRDGLMQALFNRSCYATTGERILVGMFIAGAPMGSELNTSDKPGLDINRHIAGYVAGTDKITKVEVIRNGELFKEFTPDQMQFEFAIDDMEDLSSIAIKSPDKETDFVFYYLRVQQADGHGAWSSPIWIDYHAVKKVKKIETKPKRS